MNNVDPENTQKFRCTSLWNVPPQIQSKSSMGAINKFVTFSFYYELVLSNQVV